MADAFDHIVVGGGSSGCVAAGGLVSRHGRRVLLLEAGGMDHSIFIKMPAGAFKIVANGLEYLRQWPSAPGQESGKALRLYRGNVLGGGSSINIGVYTRGNRADYDRWEATTGDAGWGWDGLLPHFVAQEGNQRLAGPAHGRDGPLKVSDPRYVPPVAHAFLAAAKSLGVTATDDFNDGRQTGAGFFQSTHYRARRCSAADAFLRPHLKDPHLRLETRARAQRLLIERGRIAGVEYLKDGVLHTARCEGDVLLCAGAYETPKLLMLSGIGPADELTAHGIAPVLDQPLIGANYLDHPMVGLTAFTKKGVGHFGADQGLALVANALRYFLFRQGPIASNGAEAAVFANLGEAGGYPTHEFYCLGVMWPDDYAPVTPAHGLTLHSCLVRPASRGTVSLNPSDIHGDVRVDTGFLREQVDLDAMVDGIEWCREVLNTAPLSAMKVGEASPGEACATRAQIADFCRQVVVTNSHAAGTCAMGSADTAVLDSQLRVRGLTGVRVLDASAFPHLPSANINAVVMAVADRGVALLA